LLPFVHLQKYVFCQVGWWSGMVEWDGGVGWWSGMEFWSREGHLELKEADTFLDDKFEELERPLR